MLSVYESAKLIDDHWGGHALADGDVAVLVRGQAASGWIDDLAHSGCRR